jgi:hypothetical protein
MYTIYNHIDKHGRAILCTLFITILINMGMQSYVHDIYNHIDKHGKVSFLCTIFISILINMGKFQSYVQYLYI